MGIGANRGSSIMCGPYKKLQFEKRAVYLIIFIECNGAIHGQTVHGDLAPQKMILEPVQRFFRHRIQKRSRVWAHWVGMIGYKIMTDVFFIPCITKPMRHLSRLYSAAVCHYVRTINAIP